MLIKQVAANRQNECHPVCWQFCMWVRGGAKKRDSLAAKIVANIIDK